MAKFLSIKDKSVLINLENVISISVVKCACCNIDINKSTVPCIVVFQDGKEYKTLAFNVLFLNNLIDINKAFTEVINTFIVEF